MDKLNQFGAFDLKDDNKKRWIIIAVSVLVILICAVFIFKGIEKMSNVPENLTEEEKIFRAMRAGEKSSLSTEDIRALNQSMSVSGKSSITPAQIEELNKSMKSE